MSLCKTAVLGLAAIALVAIGGDQATAGTTLSSAVKFTRGAHPKRQTLWIRALDQPTGGVLTMRYHRTYDPAGKGKIAGSCGVLGREGSIPIRRLRVKDRQAERSFLIPQPLEEGDRISCRMLFKQMPNVPDGSWAELAIEITGPEVLPP